VAGAPEPAGQPRVAETSGGARPPVTFDQTAVWKVGAAVLGQTALLTGLLVYFGWQRTQTTYRYFGLDVRLVGLSPTDLVLASVGSAYTPLLLLGLAYLAGTLLHSAVARGRFRSAKLRSCATFLGWALVAVGVLSTLWSWFAHRVGAIVPDNPGLAFAWLPATLAAGFALLAYVSITGQRSGVSTRLSGGPQMAFALVALLVMALFWTVSLLAVRDGRQRARYIELHDAALSEVAVLSHDNLIIDCCRVINTDLTARRGSRYRYQLAGMRLLAHGDGKYFLLPLGWRRGVDRVYTVPDEPDIRVEIIAH
jgi:hypothetical protein